MKLCYIYYETTHSTHKDIIVNSFKSDIFELFSIKTLDEYDIYVVEIEKVSKDISLKMKELFETKRYPLIYFLVSERHTLPLFQLAFFLNTKTIITTKQDTQKVVSKMKNDAMLHRIESESMTLGKNLFYNSSYMLYEGTSLSFASSQLLQDFECENLSQVEDKICSVLDIQELLGDDTPIKKMISKELDSDKTYFVKKVSNTDQHIISFESQPEYEDDCLHESRIATRVSFVELLKDKLLEKMISDLPLCIVTINLKNLKNIGDAFTKSELEFFRKEVLGEIELLLDNKLLLAQYDTDLYVVLFEAMSFKDVQEKAKNFHLQMSNFMNKQTMKTNLSLYALSLDKLDLNSTLRFLDGIAYDKLTREQTQDTNLEYINTLQENMSEEEVINFLLDSVYVNKSPVKLLNLHKGMCINTASKILIKENNSIHISFGQLQGTIMSIDKKTVIQSPIFKKDILAHVKYIDLKKQVAILDRFKILESGANLRQHGRVNCHKSIPIAISLTGSVMKGIIIDISATSIAINVKNANRLNNIINQEIGLTFYLPNQNDRNSSVKIEERASVIHATVMKEGYLKIICLFQENSKNENTILEYVYSRQRSIIKDIREMVV